MSNKYKRAEREIFGSVSDFMIRIRRLAGTEMGVKMANRALGLSEKLMLESPLR